MASRLITLVRENYAKALITQNMLQRVGITSVLSHENVIRPDASSGVEVLVNEKEFAQALDFLNRLKIEFSDPDTTAHRTRTKMLIPVDFSQQSRNAIEFAIKLSTKLRRPEIQLLSVHYVPDLTAIPYFESFLYETQVTDEIIEGKMATIRKMKQLTRELKQNKSDPKLAKIPVRSHVVDGIPSESILYFCESYKPSIVVLGTREAGEKKDFVGTTTTQIILKAHNPVLLIPSNVIFNTKKKVFKIAYATNFDESDFQSISTLIGLLANFSISLDCVHFGKSQDMVLEKARMEGMKTYFTKMHPSIPLNCHLVNQENLLDGLNEFLPAYHIDLLALTTHKRGFIQKLIDPSLTLKLFYHSPIPMLVFHA